MVWSCPLLGRWQFNPRLHLQMTYRPENDARLTKYLRKIEKKGGQLAKVVREKRLNGVFDLLEETDEEVWKARMLINRLRSPVLPAILVPPLEELDE